MWSDKNEKAVMSSAFFNSCRMYIFKREKQREGSKKE
jgi:hypothetical protein